MLKNIIKYMFVTSILGITIVSCQDNMWADYYKLQSNASDKTLMEAIENDSSLTVFTQILKKTGYDKVLSGSQTYTVWAPTNSELSTTLIDADTVNHFLNNHIARFAYSTADLAKLTSIRIKMLNGKLNSFEKSATGFTYGNANLIEKNIALQNGVLHTIDKPQGFFKNIYENVAAIKGCDSVYKYISSYDKKTFDVVNSTELSTGATGVVYDSAFIYSNNWISKYGRVNNEDSIYTMILPDKSAWDAAYAKIKPYFKTYDKLSSSTSTTQTYKTTGTKADSLQRAYTLQTLVQDLIFRKKLASIPSDSLVSTNKNVLHNPSILFAGADKYESSNGFVYKTSSLNHLTTDSWNHKIVVEAENSTGRTYNNASLEPKYVTNDLFLNLISERRYIYLSPSSANSLFQPELTVSIPNTLASSYDIYCVVVPAYEKDTAHVLDPITKQYRLTYDSTKVQFQLAYVDATGLMKMNTAITKDPVTSKVFETSPLKVSKFLVAKGFKFPFANFTSPALSTTGYIQTNTVSIKIKTNVTDAEFKTSKYTRNLRVDCFILEPSN